MVIMHANVEYVCCPCRVPCLCKEEIYSVSGGELCRVYYRWVTPCTWWSLRKVFH